MNLLIREGLERRFSRHSTIIFSLPTWRLNTGSWSTRLWIKPLGVNLLSDEGNGQTGHRMTSCPCPASSSLCLSSHSMVSWPLEERLIASRWNGWERRERDWRRDRSIVKPPMLQELEFDCLFFSFSFSSSWSVMNGINPAAGRRKKRPLDRDCRRTLLTQLTDRF